MGIKIEGTTKKPMESNPNSNNVSDPTNAISQKEGVGSTLSKSLPSNTSALSLKNLLPGSVFSLKANQKMAKRKTIEAPEPNLNSSNSPSNNSSGKRAAFASRRPKSAPRLEIPNAAVTASRPKLMSPLERILDTHMKSEAAKLSNNGNGSDANPNQQHVLAILEKEDFLEHSLGNSYSESHGYHRHGN